MSGEGVEQHNRQNRKGPQPVYVRAVAGTGRGQTGLEAANHAALHPQPRKAL